MAEKKEANQKPVLGQKPQLPEDDIRSRAYEIYCARNGGPGSELDDWLQAENELKQGGATPE